VGDKTFLSGPQRNAQTDNENGITSSSFLSFTSSPLVEKLDWIPAFGKGWNDSLFAMTLLSK
jgi:hypothetical protein